MSRPLQIDIPPHVAAVLRGLPPEVKLAVKQALRLLAVNPGAATPLRRELEGYWRFRVRRYRIVYQRESRALRIVAVDHRRTIYEDLAVRLKTESR